MFVQLQRDTPSAFTAEKRASGKLPSNDASQESTQQPAPLEELHNSALGLLLLGCVFLWVQIPAVFHPSPCSSPRYGRLTCHAPLFPQLVWLVSFLSAFFLSLPYGVAVGVGFSVLVVVFHTQL